MSSVLFAGLIEVKTTARIKNFKLRVSAHSTKPFVVSEFNGAVYQYLEIRKENADDADIAQAGIEFSVPDSWIIQKNVKPDDLILYRWSQKQWEKLPTTYNEKEVSLHTYKAITPGFSFFAIGVENSTPQVQLETPKESITTILPQEELIKSFTSNNDGMIIIVIIIVTILAAYTITRKKK